MDNRKTILFIIFIILVFCLIGFYLNTKLRKNKYYNAYELALQQNIRATRLKENLMINSKVEFLKNEFNNQIPSNQNFLLFIYNKYDCDICIKKLFEIIEYFKNSFSDDIFIIEIKEDSIKNSHNKDVKFDAYYNTLSCDRKIFQEKFSNIFTPAILLIDTAFIIRDAAIIISGIDYSERLNYIIKELR